MLTRHCLFASVCFFGAFSLSAVELGLGGGLLYPGTQKITRQGQPDQNLRVYKGGPAVDFSAHWLKGHWVEIRLRTTGFYLAKGDATLNSGEKVDAESYGATAFFEGQVHFWDPQKSGLYLTFGAGALYYHYALNGSLGTSARFSSNDGGVSLSAGLGYQFKGGWELELRNDAHLTTNELSLVLPVIIQVDPNPSGFVLVARKRF